MKSNYPASLNSWLKDYPKSFQLVCGKEFDNLAGPWNHGSRINFLATPLSKQDQGEYANGRVLPTKEAIYTNTGFEDSWDIRITMFGHGTFYAISGVDNYFLQAEKYFKIESIHFDFIQFSHVDTHETQIPTTVEIPDVYVPEIPPIIIPENPPPPGVDPDPGPGDPVIGDPTQLSNHGSLFYEFLLLNSRELEINAPLWGMTVIDVDPTQISFSGTDEGLELHWNLYGLFTTIWSGLLFMCFKNWAGSGLIGLFLRPVEPSGWIVEWGYTYNQVLYTWWAGQPTEDLMVKIRRL